MLSLNVKRLTLSLIILLAAVNGWHAGYAHVLPQLLAAVSSAVILDAIFIFADRKKLVWSDSAAITGLIAAGVAAPDSSVGRVAAIAVIAVFSKYLIKLDRRNVFNPAALGLLFGALFLGVRLSWWMDGNHPLTIIAGSLLLAKFANRWRSILAFLAVFAVLIAGRAWYLGQPPVLELYLSAGITSFFVFFMLTDPKTSPVLPASLPAFAAVAAAGSFLSVVYHPGSIFLAGLLLANLSAVWLNRRGLRRMSEARAAAASLAATRAAAAATGTGAGVGPSGQPAGPGPAAGAV